MADDAKNGGGRRSAAACPWCGSGTPLVLRGDGLGNTTLCCLSCGCKGPPIPIGQDFDTSDSAAIERWSIRKAGAPRLDPVAIERMRFAIALQCLDHVPDQDTEVSVPFGALSQMLEACSVSGRAA